MPQQKPLVEYHAHSIKEPHCSQFLSTGKKQVLNKTGDYTKLPQTARPLFDESQHHSPNPTTKYSALIALTTVKVTGCSHLFQIFQACQVCSLPFEGKNKTTTKVTTLRYVFHGSICSLTDSDSGVTFW